MTHLLENIVVIESKLISLTAEQRVEILITLIIMTIDAPLQTKYKIVSRCNSTLPNR